MLIAFAASILLGYFDYSIGPEISFSVFYVIPIMMSVWYGGKNIGLVVSIVAATIWLSADIAAGHNYTGLFVPLWNTLVRLAFFLIILRLLLIVREKLQLEESLADTDVLTSLANKRFFLEQIEREYERIQRYPKPLTIAYIDLDNFKQVNDTMGHDEGDELLRAVASALTYNIRASDFAARLGGDEFAVIFPMLEEESALPVLEKLPSELLKIMQEKNWPVTFSIGAVTFTDVMDSGKDMIKLVDSLMYEVKKSGKNDIRHIVWPNSR